MTNEEKILIVALGVALVAVVVWRPRVDAPTEIAAPDTSVDVTEVVGLSQTPNNSSVVRGPRYFMANMPWAFGPPVRNIMPSAASSPLGGMSSPSLKMFAPVITGPDKSEEN